MHVLITGASGFVGRRVTQALLAQGSRVTAAGRAPLPDARIAFIAADFVRDTDPAAWLPRLRGVDVVINLVGIIRERGSQRFAQLHVATPRALFAACVEGGVQGVIQLSALGADEHAATEYHLSKKAADDYLAALPLRSAIVQPSLIFGPGGGSAELFKTLAVLPLGVRLGRSPQLVQPIHIDDVAEAIVRLANSLAPAQPAAANGKAAPAPPCGSRRIALVGPEAMPLQDYLAALRRTLGLEPQRVLTLPDAAARAFAWLGSVLPGLPMDRDALRMLERGNTADPADTAALLGRPPRAVQDFMAPAQRGAERTLAQLNWLLPLLRLSIAAVWIITAYVSALVYPEADSYRLLQRTGVPSALGPLMLYGAAGLDLLLGVATLALPQRLRSPLWLAQIALIVFYSVLIAWRLPEFLAHPYGPLTKNLPMLAAIWLLYELEKGKR
ncbi:NADH dehydrogenase [Massilia sp. Root418]|jgi:uncharacterized protein YbjT (DUF2867 family)|uniref:SDR family oxidoreductase n=1 Tax=Massilia sp. Root418 TaxID=1736532 RepID=UPI0006F6DA71|nr:SDR family oxidoreductase [Massilia sp. Root418]KQW87949.1 NADH dehydrogenase [Massilia sp. Root418]